MKLRLSDIPRCTSTVCTTCTQNEWTENMSERLIIPLNFQHFTTPLQSQGHLCASVLLCLCAPQTLWRHRIAVKSYSPCNLCLSLIYSFARVGLLWRRINESVSDCSDYSVSRGSWDLIFVWVVSPVTVLKVCGQPWSVNKWAPLPPSHPVCAAKTVNHNTKNFAIL